MLWKHVYLVFINQKTCLVRVYLIKKKEANNLYKIIFIIGGERRKSFYRVLKRGETGLIRKKKEKERVLSHQHGTHGFQNIYSSAIASIV